jgi:hypothetical protein
MKLLPASRRPFPPSLGGLLITALLFLRLSSCGTTSAAALGMSSFPRTSGSKTEKEDDAAAEAADVALTSRNLLEETIRRRLFNTGLVGDSFPRLLQQNGSLSCDSKLTASEACIIAKMGNTSTTAWKDCFDCMNAKLAVAIDDFFHSPSIDCAELNDIFCQPASECACALTCEDEYSASMDCQLREIFTGGSDTAVFNCMISCPGTNVTINDDSQEVNSTDDYVGGLCRREEAAVKLCLESMGSSVDACYQCIQANGILNLAETITCAEVQDNTCKDMASCPCMEDCGVEFVERSNCLLFYASGHPLLNNCFLSVDACQAGGSGSAGSTSAAFAKLPRKWLSEVIGTLSGLSLVVSVFAEL